MEFTCLASFTYLKLDAGYFLSPDRGEVMTEAQQIGCVYVCGHIW